MEGITAKNSDFVETAIAGLGKPKSVARRTVIAAGSDFRRIKPTTSRTSVQRGASGMMELIEAHCGGGMPSTVGIPDSWRISIRAGR